MTKVKLPAVRGGAATFFRVRVNPPVLFMILVYSRAPPAATVTRGIRAFPVLGFRLCRAALAHLDGLQQGREKGRHRQVYDEGRQC